jgi:acyl-coenzyme A synthetase/AMP-(fatty) acid ligase
VVLREGQQATERELQAFVSTRAADYKVPKKILLLDEIPKGATGKLQRIGLAQKLGLG